MATIIESNIIDVEFGPKVRVVKPVNMYGCRVGAKTFVGPFTEIQKGVNIGRNCRIQSHTFICELVTIGDDCFIGHGVVFINDLFDNAGPAQGPAASRYDERASGFAHRINLYHHLRRLARSLLLPASVLGGEKFPVGSV